MVKRPSKTRNMSVYSNLVHKRRTKKDATARKKAEYLASLPKNPMKRTLYRMHPKRVAKYWFSKKGAITALKVAGVGILFMFLMVGALFAYYRKDLDSIKPGQLANRVQTTVTRYYDRNDKLLWEDKGSGNYKLVVDRDEISESMRQATIAIEDKEFYEHGAISFSGITRSAINNLIGSGETQGGSTLTQQLVKQVFLADEAADRSLGGIPRKIKEMILSIEVERMYDKDHILNLYLNESPYGGRRNGVESAAQTYFGTTAKKLTIPQSALLAAIPNQPGLYDPYNIAGHEALIARQHKVLDSMLSEGYITQKEADDAKAYPILDHIKPLSNQYVDIKAPHFVQMVRQQLESSLGKATVGQGGLNVYTTLDLTIQKQLEKEMAKMFASHYPSYAGFSNGAASVEDVKTGQIIALMGSRNFEYPGFGQDNAATAFIQPGSSIKPLVYAQLFQNQGEGKTNYGSGSIISDVRTTFGTDYTPQNADRGFRGNITVRNSLDWSRNIPAIKAMSIAGKDETWQTIRAMGDKDYCTRGSEVDAGLSSAIGSCGTRLVDHTNAMASLARMGSNKPHTGILKVTNSNNQVLQKYKDESKKVIDPQAAYVVNDILGDSSARAGLAGRDYLPLLAANGIKVAAKTGTSDTPVNGVPRPKDIWTVGYTPNLAMSVWLGNSDSRPLTEGNSLIPAEIFDAVMTSATKQYVKEGKAKLSDWFTAPKGIQKIGREVFPSYYDKNKAQTKFDMTFSKVSKKKAADCTPKGAQVKIEVMRSVDPYSKQVVIVAPDGYNPYEEDDCGGDKSVSISGGPYVSCEDGNKCTISATAEGKSLRSIEFKVNGRTIDTINISKSGTYRTSYTFSSNSTHSISAIVTNRNYYTDSATRSYSPNSD